MNSHTLALLSGVLLLIALAGPVRGDVTPLWIEHGTSGGDLSCVIISPDDSTILVGGDQLMSLSTYGKNRWTGWSGSHLSITSQGDYILASQGPTVRLISSRGTLIWEQSMETTVTDVSIAPDASLIAATGGGRLRTITFAGVGIASNDTMSINHLSVLPSGRQILVTTSNDIQILDPALRSNWTDTNSTQDLLSVAPDGSSFVTATNNRVRMYQGTGNLVWDRRLSFQNIEALAYSRDHSTIVLGTDHNNILVLNGDGTQLWSANATNWITSVAVSGDGNTIVAGSLDKKAYVFNHAGAALGTFDTKTAIRFNSVAVTGDGSLIVVVDSSAAYGIPRSSFTSGAATTGTLSGGPSETTAETPATVPPVTTARKVTSRMPTVPTPYPTESETTEATLLPAVPFLALLVILLCRGKRT